MPSGKRATILPMSPRRARRDGGGYILDGAKSLVLHGDSADKFVISARLAGGQRERDGIGLFLVDAAAPGLSRRGYATVDGVARGRTDVDRRAGR